MSQHAAASGHPTTFNTNVNRAKTKKWVEAKSYSYDGDDWGDVDDYDEYGGYDEPEAAPEPKPTGLRQRGQSASQMPRDPYSIRQDPYQSPVDSRLHGNVGGPPGRQQQQQYGSRSATNPQPQPSGMRRMNSFDPEDERRAFSAGGPPQSIGNTGSGASPISQYNQGQSVAAHDFQPGQKYQDQRPQGQPTSARPSVQTPRRPSMDEAANYSGLLQQQAGTHQDGHTDQPRQSSTDGRTQSMASTNSALDFHNRRDFSPSALPPPLQTRGSPSPHSNSPSSHPPRKSSMGQEAAPALLFGAQAPPTTGIGDIENSLPSARERASSGASKALPFVRPAEIYRRMQEEKEKERQSQDSARPSMDTLIAKPNERPDLGGSQNSEAGQRLKPTLDPVTERRSEYGLEGVDLNEQPKPEERRPTTSKKFELPNRKSTPSVQGSSGSLQPMLPDVSRVSGFGESFFGSTSSIQEPSQEPLMNFGGSTAPAPAQQEQNRPAPEKDLRNQPSLGFTSAVHEAFDRAEDQVPPTPSSAAGSTVERSTSGGTSAVSPIISRGPSTSTENWRSKLPGIDDVTTSPVDAHAGNSSRPLSSSSLGTPTQVARKPSPSAAVMPQSTDLPSPSFVPGHRRNLSTPSPDNSPARTPALEVNRHLRQPQEVELAAATPTDPSFSKNNSSDVSELAKQKPISTHPSEIASRGRSGLQVDTHPMVQDFPEKAGLTGSPMPYPQNYLRTRTDSGSSSRVRDLADKFESGSRPGSAHSATPRNSMFGNNMQKDDLVPPRPLADRMESFRPHLPGGWESSASIVPAAALRRQEPAVDRIHPESIATISKPKEDLATSADQAPSSVSQIKDASEEAFSAVAAAGSALAGAFAAAVGMDQHNGPEASPVETPSDEHPEERRSRDSGATPPKRNVSMDRVVNPESKPYLPDPIEDEASSIAPTPLPKDTPLHRTNDSESPDYFSPSKNQERPGTAGRSEDTAPANRPSMLPSLSTDTETHQYESDRLRREIVRELNPMNTSEPTTAQSDYSNYEDTSRLSTNQSLPRPGHGSGVLPREYESYWNDANSDDNTSQLSGEPGRLEDATTAHRQHGAAVISEPLRPHQLEQDTSTSETMSLGPKQQYATSGPTNTGEASQGSPRVLQHRFSWEQPLQSPQPLPADPYTIDEAPHAPVTDFQSSADPDNVREVPDAPVSEFLRSAVYPEGQSFDPKDRPKASQLPTLSNPEATLGNDASRLLDQDASFPESQNELSQHDELASIEKELPGYKNSLEVTPSPLHKDHAEQMNSSYDNSTYRPSQQSPVLKSEQRPDGQRPLIEPSLPNHSTHEPSPTFGAQNDELPPFPPPNAQPKITAFREILALKSPSERIQAFNETREQFANLNTGLAHWLAVKASELPEHADLFKDSGRRPAFHGHKPSPSRSKLGGLLQSGSQSAQPYSNTPTSVPDGAPGNASPYGYSPSAGPSTKISSQQVQAKGKDLLHTAGVFGGKANVAAKGLFSKGKSKLRGGSGTEKALLTPPQPYNSEPRGMQQQPKSIEEQPTVKSAGSPTTTSSVPILQALGANFDRTTTHPTVSPRQGIFANGNRVDTESAAKEPPQKHVNSNEAKFQTSSREYQPLHHPSGQRSPRDTPSLESFTQSQEGDDERSEESASTNQEHPPRASSLYLKGVANHRQIRFPQAQTAVRDNAPDSVRQRPLGDPRVGSPKEVLTPRSASSNQTPTQATFTDAGLPAIPAESAVRVDGATIQHRRGAGSSPKSFSQPQSGSSTQLSNNNRRSQEPGATTRFSHDSKGSYQTPSGQDGLLENPLSTLDNPQNQHVDVDPYSQAPTEINIPRRSETNQEGFLQSPTNVPDARPVPLVRNPLNPQTPSQDHSWRGPSIDSDLGRVNLDHPPSPLTPRQPTDHGAPQTGRTGPIHYGIDHDFDRSNDMERCRSRSTSYSGELQNIRRSQDSRPSLDPNILDHPAFRAVAEGNGMPTQDYPTQDTREENTTPRQQTAGHVLMGGGPTIGRRSESKSRSRRGSRSSAFFKAFTSPSKSDHFPLSNAPDSQAGSSPKNSPALGDRRSKRLSIFGSRSGNIGSGSGNSHSKENMAAWDASPQDSFTQVAHQVGPATPRRVETDNPSKGVSSKWTKKLQRASTSAKPEPDSGKKKRFSAIGTLFGGRKRQSSTSQSQVPSQQSFQQSHAVEPRSLEKHDYGPPSEEQIQPPREGYYAPSRGDGRSSHSRSRQDGQPYPRAPDAPAYVQDSILRVHQLMSPVEQPPNAAMPRTSATFPQRSPQHEFSSVPRSSTSTQKGTAEAFPRRSEDRNKASGSSWTRFSTHARSKSRPEKPQPPSNGALSSPPPKPYAPAAPSNSPATGRRSFQEPVRSESPPPPPPPPKDDWHRTRPRDPSSLSPSGSNQHPTHSPTPSQSSSLRPASTQQRRSLPPLLTNINNNKNFRSTAIGSGKTLTPEEKRKSRQMEIERSGIPLPQAQQQQSPARNVPPPRLVQAEDEEEPVMSATSFPGQMWQPSNAHWDE